MATGPAPKPLRWDPHYEDGKRSKYCIASGPWRIAKTCHNGAWVYSVWHKSNKSMPGEHKGDFETPEAAKEYASRLAGEQPAEDR